MTAPPDDAEALYARVPKAAQQERIAYHDTATAELLESLLARCRAVDKEVQHLRELCVDHGIDCD